MSTGNYTYHLVFEVDGVTKHASLEIAERKGGDVMWVLETLANESTGTSSCVGQALADAMVVLLARGRVTDVMRIGPFRYEPPTADEIRAHADNNNVARSKQRCGLWVVQEGWNASTLVGLRINESGAIEIHHGVGDWQPMPCDIVAKWWAFDPRRGMVAWPVVKVDHA